MRAAAILLLLAAGSCSTLGAAAPPPSPTLVVRVCSAGETPVPGARVELFHGPAEADYTDYDALLFRPSGDPPRALSKAVTDATGAAAFELPPPGRYWVSATAAGFGRETSGVTIDAEATRPEVVVPLVPWAPLDGTITGDAGEPWAGVEVIAAPTLQCRVWPCDAACDRARTDAKGRFRFDALAPGEYGIWYRPEGGEPVSAGIVRVPLVAHLPVHACRGGVVAGVVKDTETGAPLEGAAVRLLDSDDAILVEARTDRAGRFEAATHLAACDISDLAVALQGYAPTPVRIADAFMERLSDGQRLDLDIALAKGAILRGRVLSPLGPVAGIRVSCENGVPPWRKKTTTISGADGVYRFSDLDPGQYRLRMELTTRHEEEFPGDVDVPAGADVVHDLRLDDLRLSDVKGRVVDMEGNPVPDARVWSGEGPRRDVTHTDAQGRFALRVATLHGIGEITTESPNLIGGRDAIDVVDGDVEIRMIRTGGLRGQVRAADGTPVAGARIAAGSWISIREGTTTTPPFEFDNLREGLTAPDGSYEFRVPRDGVRAWWADLLRAWSPVDGAMVETSDGSDDGDAWRFDVSFAQTRTVSGRAVLRGSKRGIEGLVVSLVTDEFNSASVICAVTGADGRFSVRLPFDEEASIRVEGDGYIAKAVKPGEGDEFLVEMEADLPVAGVVRRADGSPAFLTAVTLQGPDGWTSEASMTDTGGRFVITGVPAGDYVLLVDGASAARVRAGNRGLEVVAPAPE